MNEQRAQKIRKTMGVILLTLICLAVLLCIGFAIYMYIQKQEYKKPPKPTYSTEVLIDKGVLGDWSIEIMVSEPSSPRGILPVYGFDWAMRVEKGVISFYESDYDFMGGEASHPLDDQWHEANDVLQADKTLKKADIDDVTHDAIYDGHKYVWASAAKGNWFYEDGNKTTYEGEAILLFVYEKASSEVVYAQVVYLEDYCVPSISQCFRVTVDGVTYPCHDVTQE